MRYFATIPLDSLASVASMIVLLLPCLAASESNPFPGDAPAANASEITPSPRISDSPPTGGEPEPEAEAALPEPFATESAALKNQVMALIAPERHYRELLADIAVKTYRDRGFRPLWDSDQLPDGLGFQRALSNLLATHAFPDLFSLDPEALLPAIADETVERRDLAYTVAILDAALLTRVGIVPSSEIWPEWNEGSTPGSDEASVSEISGDLVVASSLSPFDLEKILEVLGPKNWIYRELHKAYPAAREAILRYSGLPSIPDPSTAGVGEPGQPYPYASAVALHLIDKGYLAISPEAAGAFHVITPELSSALMAFQRDYGLDPDGIFGPATWSFLNTNAADRYRSLSINLHRARFLPANMGERYVVANLPCSELYLFERNDFHVATMRIVYGRASPPERRTPLFRDVLREVVFAPYWNVPPNIAVNEIIPRSQEDGSFLHEYGYEIVSDFNPYNKSTHDLSAGNLELVNQRKLFFRQKPGPKNALGQVKFLFPNNYSVYMHDTPAKEFFSQTRRDHSYGCVRVSRPDVLGEWALRNQGWNMEKVQQAMQGSSEQSHSVSDTINVYIMYLTTFPRPVGGGRIVLAPGRDVYEYDPADSAKLGTVLPWNSPSAVTTR